MGTPILVPFFLKSTGTTAAAAYTCPALKTSVVVGCDVCNTTSGQILVTVFIRRSGVDYYLANETPVAVGGTLQAIYGQRQVLSPGDAIYIKSNTATSCDTNGAVTEDVN